MFNIAGVWQMETTAWPKTESEVKKTKGSWKEMSVREAGKWGGQTERQQICFFLLVSRKWQHISLF